MTLAPEAIADEKEESRPLVRRVTLGIGVPLVLVVAAIVAPNLMHARKSANEANAIGALKTITTAQSVFREGDKESDGNLDYGMLSELGNVALVDEVLGSGRKQGYTFGATYSYTTSEFLWFAVANPVRPGSSGDRYFATSAAGVIFYNTDEPTPLDTGRCRLPR